MRTTTSLFLFTPLLLAACATDEVGSPELVDRGTTHVHTASGILEVGYERHGDHVLIQGDIAVPADQFEHAMIDPADLEDALEGGRERAAVLALGRKRWPGGRVPFRLDPNLTPGQRTIIDAAILHWHANTPIRFVAQTNETDFVNFIRGDFANGCFATIGRAGGPQTIEVDVCNVGGIIHEMGHTVGFWHEQSRYDRDAFVTVNWENILDGQAHNFQRYVDMGADGADAGDYDYGSIMHYRANAFTNGNGDTLTPKQAGVTIGQSSGLSRGDIEAAHRLFSPGGTYDAGPKITLHTNTSFGGVSQSFGPGIHTARNNTFGTIADNAASSISIPPGLMVEVWTGSVDDPRTFFGASQASLAAPFNDSISGVTVMRAVTAYREAGQWGVNQTFRIGEWKANAGQMSVIGNDQISSLYVPDGLVAELCTAEVGGTCQTFEGGVSYVGNAMNDQASMIRVKPAVTLFQEGNLWGNRKSLTAGTYSYGSFAPVLNNNLSSLVVGDSLKATVCDGSSGAGPCEVFRGDVNFVGYLNDRASWIKIETNTNP